MRWWSIPISQYILLGLESLNICKNYQFINQLSAYKIHVNWYAKILSPPIRRQLLLNNNSVTIIIPCASDLCWLDSLKVRNRYMCEWQILTGCKEWEPKTWSLIIYCLEVLPLLHMTIMCHISKAKDSQSLNLSKLMLGNGFWILDAILGRPTNGKSMIWCLWV